MPTRAETISRGAQAKALKDNDVLLEAFDSVLTSLWEGFLQPNTTEEFAVSIHRQALAVQAVRTTLQSFIDEASVEEANQKLDDGKS